MEQGRVVEHFGRTKESAREFIFNVEGRILDMLSSMYYLRQIEINELGVNEKIPFRIFFDKELFELNVNFLGGEKKKLKGIGNVDTCHLQPELIEGYVFSEGDLMDIWLSKDDNKIPLFSESPIRFGSIKAILKSASGLKFPFNYKLKQ